jgi:hypothetical protein
MPLALAVGAALLTLPSASQARSAPQTLRLRASVPAAGDITILSFELSIGGEGRRHRRQAVSLKLVTHKQPGVFAQVRIHAVPHRPGRFLGVLEIFHLATAHKAAWGSPADRVPASARSAGVVDELAVTARNEHVIRHILKANIIALAEAHHLGPDEFCMPTSLETYLRGNAVIGGAFSLAGPLANLPTTVDLTSLGEDAIEELCDSEEDYEEGDFLSDDEQEYAGLEILYHALGRPMTAVAPTSAYHVLLSGGWSFEGPGEVKLTGMLYGVSSGYPLAHSADSTNPVDAIKVVVPAAGASPRAVTNYICPAQLPSAAVTTTSRPNDTLVCSGGSLPIGAQFTLNVQTVPLPASGMGGQLIVHQDGAYLAPLQISGP